MASDLEHIVKQGTELLFTMQRIEESSKATAKNFAELYLQFKRAKWPMSEQILGSVKIGQWTEQVSTALLATRDKIEAVRDQMKAAQTEYERQDAALQALRQKGASSEQIAAQKHLADQHLQIVNKLTEQEQGYVRMLPLSDQLAKFTGTRFTFESAYLAGLKETIRASGELNTYLIEANSSLRERRGLADQVYEVTAATGAEQRGVYEAAKQLTLIGFETRSRFKSVLEVMVQMKDGLGVSYDNSAQLARVFEINLNTSVRSVADQITAIKNSTSLAADEATRFAVEVGKALRLLGPGAIQGSAERVTGYVTMMAARMKDVGGNAEDIVKMFSEMTKGTSQGFMLRGLAGQVNPGALGTEAGSRQAMEGVNRMINTIVKSAPGTREYVAQLQMASELFGTSADTIRLWQEMMVKSNQPLNESQKLQEAWRTQMAASNMAWHQVRESIMALVRRAFIPLLAVVVPVLQGIAHFVGWIASHQVLAYAAFTAVIVGVGRLVWSLGRLTAELWKAVVASTALANAQGAGRLPPLGTGDLARVTHERYLKLGETIKDAFRTGWKSLIDFWKGLNFAKLGSGIWSGIKSLGHTLASGAFWKGLLSGFRNLNGLLWSVVGRLGMVGPLAAVAAAGAAGYAVGGWINKTFPENWMTRFSHWVSKGVTDAYYHANAHVASTGKFKGDMMWYDLTRNIRQLVYQGRESEVGKYFRENVHRVKGMETERGAARLLQDVQEAVAQARERIGLSSVSSAEKEVKARDKQIIDMTRQMIDNTGGAKKVLQDVEARRKADADQLRRDIATERMKQQVNLHLPGDPHTPTKLEASGLMDAMKGW